MPDASFARVLVIGESVAAYAAAVALAGHVKVIHARGYGEYLHSTTARTEAGDHPVGIEQLEAFVFDLFRRFGVERRTAFDWLEDAGDCVRAGSGPELVGERFDAAVFAPQGSGRVDRTAWENWWGPHASTDPIGDTAYGFSPPRVAIFGSGRRLVRTLSAMTSRPFAEVVCLVEAGVDAEVLSALDALGGTARWKLSLVPDVLAMSPLHAGGEFRGVRARRLIVGDCDYPVSFVGFAGELAASWDGLRGPIGARVRPCGVALGVCSDDFLAQWASGERAAREMVARLRGEARPP